MDTDNLDDITLFANTATQAKSLLQSLEQTAGGIDIHMNANKTDSRSFNQGADSTLNGSSLRLVDKFIYLCNSASSTEFDINMHLTKVWTAINGLLIIWKSDLIDKRKQDFFQVVVVSILLYERTPWTLTKCIEKKTQWELHMNAMSYIEHFL